MLDEEDASESRLPLVHTTSLYSFEDLCSEDRIDPTHCQHFNEKLLYLFYGRPAYRTETAEFNDLSFNWPIVFVLDPSKIDDLKAVYPFDTGAFYLGLYRRFFSKKSEAEDFKLPGSLEYAEKLVDAFYSNKEEYLRGRSTKNTNIPLFNFEAEGIQKLSREPSFTSRISEDQVTRDERSSSIEIQTENSIDIADATLAIVLPSAILDEPMVVDALDRWGLAKEAVRYYDVQGFHGTDSWLGQIYAQISIVYRDHGFLDGGVSR
ncbi:hypothetical protein [Leisingera daeponensis]|uniref:hypothetical protein n=1 Tax=Leisingera daeponensis TaxID=405746 RepID=UPI001C98980C|nr:hypothetical protein [Leisingera daeponensis]MBY6059140.1 hypothetical protein [Leisingera daeponensis]